MKALLLLVFGMMGFIQIAHAQSLSPVVISPSGSFFQNSDAMLSSTVGEMTMVETFAAAGSILTQGFQQPFDLPVGIPFLPATRSPEIYPNPSSGNITVVLPEHSGDKITIQVFDAIGKSVFLKVFQDNASSSRVRLFLNNLVVGMYVVEIKTNANKYFKKINIIR